MALLTQSEFTQMERLLAGLMVDATMQEEEMILHLHTRLQAICNAQSELYTSRDRLTALRLQTGL
ncbi:MAG: hypothetical protein KUG74_10875 [Rhodobacteraceae bacterium]|nr:hypothetical protein [Paracoccaceae bacterium]